MTHQWTLAPTKLAISRPSLRWPDTQVLTAWLAPDSIQYAFSNPGGIHFGGVVKANDPTHAEEVAALRWLVGPPPWEVTESP